MKWVLALALLLASCAPTPVPVVVPPEPSSEPTNYILLPDVPGSDRVCIVIDGPPFPPESRGIHCLRIEDLRWLLGRQRATEQ